MIDRTTVGAAALMSYMAVACAGAAQKADSHAQAAAIKWADSLRQAPEWYAGDEAARIADNLLLYQLGTGGWQKNIDMARRLSGKEKVALGRQKKEGDSTIDNGATYTQLAFLARVYTARKLDRHKEAFLKGVDYLLKAQYENGGWPQYYPRMTGYYRRITFNDDAMIGVMKLLSDVAEKKPAYSFVDEGRRARAEKAVGKGVELILKAQVVVGGRRTVWGAQHNEVTLAPAGARKFEPASLCAGESVGIVRFLMGVNDPCARVVESIESAIAWFERTRISGLRWAARGPARAAIKDPQAPPLWARFYEIGTDRPIFAGRDGKVRYDVLELDDERRDGYAWYVNTPAGLLEEDYPAWKKKWDVKPRKEALW
jgi:PelA/Pel-15E family pectate lyase